MEILQTILSLSIGGFAGIIYGYSFLPHGLLLPDNKKVNTKKVRQKTFASFFFFSMLRILLIGSLLYYILHTQTVNIILVVLAFLTSFWFIIIKKKIQRK